MEYLSHFEKKIGFWWLFSNYDISGYLVDSPLPSRFKPGVASMEYLSHFEKNVGFDWLFFSNHAKSEYLVDFPSLPELSQVLPFWSSFSHFEFWVAFWVAFFFKTRQK